MKLDATIVKLGHGKRVLVCGGRDYEDFVHLTEVLNAVRPATVITGGARGADRLAMRWAAHVGVPLQTYPAKWDEHGRSAGPIRNQQMLDEGKPDLVLAFPGGAGTADMVRRARAQGFWTIEVP